MPGPSLGHQGKEAGLFLPKGSHYQEGKRHLLTDSEEYNIKNAAILKNRLEESI